jgi:hypothetical protein
MHVDYTEEQKVAFCALAAQVGVSPAVRTLGYPSVQTGTEWCRQRAVQTNPSALRQAARASGLFYGEAESRVALQAVLDHAYDMLVHGEEVEAEEQVAVPGQQETTSRRMTHRRPLNALTLPPVAKAVKGTVEAISVLDGRASDRTEQITGDSSELELQALIREQRAANATRAQAIKDQA